MYSLAHWYVEVAPGLGHLVTFPSWPSFVCRRGVLRRPVLKFHGIMKVNS